MKEIKDGDDLAFKAGDTNMSFKDRMEQVAKRDFFTVSKMFYTALRHVNGGLAIDLLDMANIVMNNGGPHHKAKLIKAALKLQSGFRLYNGVHLDIYDSGQPLPVSITGGPIKTPTKPVVSPKDNNPWRVPSTNGYIKKTRFNNVVPGGLASIGVTSDFVIDGLGSNGPITFNKVQYSPILISLSQGGVMNKFVAVREAKRPTAKFIYLHLLSILKKPFPGEYEIVTGRYFFRFHNLHPEILEELVAFIKASDGNIIDYSWLAPLLELKLSFENKGPEDPITPGRRGKAKKKILDYLTASKKQKQKESKPIIKPLSYPEFLKKVHRPLKDKTQAGALIDDGDDDDEEEKDAPIRTRVLKKSTSGLIHAVDESSNKGAYKEINISEFRAKIWHNNSYMVQMDQKIQT